MKVNENSFSANLLDSSIHGSFRDPGGFVFTKNDRIYRLVKKNRSEALIHFLNSDFYKKNENQNIVGTWQTQLSEKSDEFIFEHSKLNLITYPYEWSFRLLQKAAIKHLELHLESLKYGFDLIDSTAFNIQFKGVKPIFIDLLSFQPYTEGSYWFGYKQFCEQFLGPLLLTCKSEIPFNDWYKGTLNGISLQSISNLLPLSTWISPSILIHIHLHAKLVNKLSSTNSHKNSNLPKTHKPLKKSSYLGILNNMLQVVSDLSPRSKTYWNNYEEHNSYSTQEQNKKMNFLKKFINEFSPKTVWDMGCNSGAYSELCLIHGVESVVGTDFDQAALDKAVTRAETKNLSFTPLYLDIMNPSASVGWRLLEREDIFKRIKVDALIVLALIHHLCIGNNVPLEQVVRWLVSLAPSGIIEFVPLDDPMVVEMLEFKKVDFHSYNFENFKLILQSLANILFEEKITEHGRMLVAYQRI